MRIRVGMWPQQHCASHSRARQRHRSHPPRDSPGFPCEALCSMRTLPAPGLPPPATTMVGTAWRILVLRAKRTMVSRAPCPWLYLLLLALHTHQVGRGQARCLRLPPTTHPPHTHTGAHWRCCPALLPASCELLRSAPPSTGSRRLSAGAGRCAGMCEGGERGREGPPD